MALILSSLLLLNLFSTSVMIGVIWIVQVLVYPDFRRWSRERFKEYHQNHTRKITWIVAPTMLCEAATAALLIKFGNDLFFLINFILVVLIWLWTGFVSVPLHNRLQKEEAVDGLITKLVETNWVRTVLWTLRGLALIYAALHYF